MLHFMPAELLHRHPQCICTLVVSPAHGDAQLWAVRIEAAQAPLLMSSRDGRLLRPVPLEARLAPGALREALTLAAGGRLATDARGLLCGAWQRGSGPDRLSLLQGPPVDNRKKRLFACMRGEDSLSHRLARHFSCWA